MIPDHIIEEVNTRERCGYCTTKMDDKPWISSFSGKIHYKEIKCSVCGKTNRVKVDFAGSGHDSWDKTNKWLDELNKNHKIEKQSVKQLEPRIKELERVDKFGK